MTKRWAFLLIFAILGPGCENPGFSQPVAQSSKKLTCTVTRQDYAVYSAVLSGRGRPEDPEETWDDKPELTVGDTTIPGGGFFREHKNGWAWGFRSPLKQKPAADTQRDFNAKLDSTCALKALMDHPPVYTLISRKEVDEIFKKNQDGWAEFYKRHPQSSGIWSFSRVGYNIAKNEALVYLAHSCGMLCGTGHLYLLTKEDGGWVVKNKLMLWIS
jgi:hypothetical protein